MLETSQIESGFDEQKVIVTLFSKLYRMIPLYSRLSNTQIDMIICEKSFS